MRLRWLVVSVLTVALWTGPPAEAVPAREGGLSVSSNFASLLPIGVLEELAAAPTLVGVGGYGRFAWIWALHARPWVQYFPAEDRHRLAGGLDLIWGDPSRAPDLTYVGFGIALTNFLPLPITNFVLGYQTGRADCNLHLEARFLFITTFEVGWGCGF